MVPQLDPTAKATAPAMANAAAGSSAAGIAPADEVPEVVAGPPSAPQTAAMLQASSRITSAVNIPRAPAIQASTAPARVRSGSSSAVRTAATLAAGRGVQQGDEAVRLRHDQLQIAPRVPRDRPAGQRRDLPGGEGGDRVHAGLPHQPAQQPDQHDQRDDGVEDPRRGRRVLRHLRADRRLGPRLQHPRRRPRPASPPSPSARSPAR